MSLFYFAAVRSVYSCSNARRFIKTLEHDPNNCFFVRTALHRSPPQVWGLLSQCPELLQQHSRTVVPLFLGFMQYQYLGDKAFPEDPEARAVEISSHLTPSERASEGPSGWDSVVRTGGFGRNESVGGVRRTADRRSVRGRLVALLGVFASAPGPKSLYKQRVLFRVYRALMVMPDEKVAGLALQCMLSYKPPYLVPYKVRGEQQGRSLVVLAGARWSC